METLLISDSEDKEIILRNLNSEVSSVSPSCGNICDCACFCDCDCSGPGSCLACDSYGYETEDVSTESL